MPTRLLPQTTSVRRETVGHGCGADAVYTARNANSTMIRQRQESTKDAHLGRIIGINPSIQVTEAESADPSRSQHERRALAATVLRHHDGAVPHVLVTLVLVTHAVPPPTAEATVVAPTNGADHRRQGGDDVTTSTTSPNQIDLEGVDAKATAIVLEGQLAVGLRGGPTRTETRLHWDGLKVLQIQAYVARHQTASRANLRVGTTVMAFAKTAARVVTTIPPHAGL